jgi:ubiquinone/menaquinone biosynthesis C-methylase UbiE
MNLKELQKHWHKFGKQDPLWAIITSPDKKGGKWKPDEFFDSGKTHVNGVMAYLNAKGIRVQRNRVLDFGCGAGRVTQALADHFEEVCGVDIAPSMIKLARKYNCHGARCKYYVNDADDLKLFSSNSFDFVYTIIVLQHMLPAYAMAYIKEFVRVLAPGGILMFQIPSENMLAPANSEPQVQPPQGEEGDGAMQTIKRFLKRLTPRPLLVWYVQIRYAERAPRMEMHCVEKDRVLSLLRENGAEVLDIVDDGASGAGFVSLSYTVTKARAS